MKAGRFLHWYKARVKVAGIQTHLAAGRTVYICSMTHITKLTAKHANMVKATKSGAWLQRGKRWDCIDYCGIRITA